MEDFRKKSNQVLSDSVVKEAGQLHSKSNSSINKEKESESEDLSPEDLKEIEMSLRTQKILFERSCVWVRPMNTSYGFFQLTATHIFFIDTQRGLFFFSFSFFKYSFILFFFI